MEFKIILEPITYNYDTEIKQPEQKCMFDTAMEAEMKKPWWLRSSSFLISCPCPKHRTYC